MILTSYLGFACHEQFKIKNYWILMNNIVMKCKLPNIILGYHNVHVFMYYSSKSCSLNRTLVHFSFRSWKVLAFKISTYMSLFEIQVISVKHIHSILLDYTRYTFKDIKRWDNHFKMLTQFPPIGAPRK